MRLGGADNSIPRSFQVGYHLAMLELSRKLIIFLFLSAGLASAASLKDIRTSSLPDDSAVKAALLDAQQMEPWVRAYSPSWNAPVTKEEAVARLAMDMHAVEVARAKHPESEEIALLSGLIASYAFNLDVKDSWVVAPDALDAAIKISPNDLRGKWFLAAHNCQTGKFLIDGMTGMLEVEAANHEVLPASFWIDYIACATETLMPAHAFHAASYLHGTDLKDPLVDAVMGKMKGTASPQTEYKPEELWSSFPTEGGTFYRSYACGISFTAPSEWKPQFYPIAHGVCAVVLEMPPFKGVDGAWVPNVAIVAHAESASDMFADYAENLEGKRGVKVGNPQLKALCPVANCRTSDIFDRSLYPSEGGAHAWLLQLDRAQPPVSGIALEPGPRRFSTADSGNHRPPNYLARFPGNIYYSILLDSAVSILPQANPMFTDFVKTIRVD